MRLSNLCTVRRVSLLLAASLAACVNLGDDEPSVTVWEGQFAPDLAHPDVAGTVAAVSDPTGTAISIAVTGADGGQEHAWGLHVGTCSAPGQQIGPDSDYPVLTVTFTGSAEATTHIAPRLSLGTAYYAEIRASATDDARVACADLTAR